jgi:hypothetical protein
MKAGPILALPSQAKKNLSKNRQELPSQGVKGPLEKASLSGQNRFSDFREKSRLLIPGY